MKEIKVKLDEPFRITVIDNGIEYFSDQYEFDSTTLIITERRSSAELRISPTINKALKKIQVNDD